MKTRIDLQGALLLTEKEKATQQLSAGQCNLQCEADCQEACVGLGLRDFASRVCMKLVMRQAAPAGVL